MGLLKIIIVVAIFLAAGAGVYYISMQQVELHDVRITDVKMKGITALTLTGDVDVHNGGFLKFNVKNITYSIIVEESGNTFTSGIVEGGLLKAGETKTFPFENEINIMTSSETILIFLNSNNTYVMVKGTITLANDLKVPFEKRIDLSPYMEDFAESNLNPLIGEDSVEMAKGLVGALGAAFT